MNSEVRGRRGRDRTASAPGEVVSAWDTDTDPELLQRIEELGEASLPVLADLFERIPTADGAMLCTADGYNMCALGLEENQVGRLAAMTSTLFSVSDGAMDAVAPAEAFGTFEKAPLEHVTLRSGEMQYIVFPIKHERLGYVLMSLWAEQVSLGELLMEARISARELAGIVNDDAGADTAGDPHHEVGGVAGEAVEDEAQEPDAAR